MWWPFSPEPGQCEVEAWTEMDRVTTEFQAMTAEITETMPEFLGTMTRIETGRVHRPGPFHGSARCRTP